MGKDQRNTYWMTTGRNGIDRHLINVYLQHCDYKGLTYTVLSLTCEIKDLEKTKAEVRQHARDRAAGRVG